MSWYSTRLMTSFAAGSFVTTLAGLSTALVDATFPSCSFSSPIPALQSTWPPQGTTPPQPTPPSSKTPINQYSTLVTGELLKIDLKRIIVKERIIRLLVEERRRFLLLVRKFEWVLTLGAPRCEDGGLTRAP